MTGVIGYARTMLRGGNFRPLRLATLSGEIERFDETVGALHRDFEDETLTASITDEQFLQGPMSDAMTHVGQLAMLRRLHGVPVASENFIFARIDRANTSRDQADPAAPDSDWTPDRGHQPPGPKREQGI